MSLAVDDGTAPPMPIDGDGELSVAVADVDGFDVAVWALVPVLTRSMPEIARATVRPTRAGPDPLLIFFNEVFMVLSLRPEQVSGKSDKR
jgi:hypothetical protein